MLLRPLWGPPLAARIAPGGEAAAGPLLAPLCPAAAPAGCPSAALGFVRIQPPACRVFKELSCFLHPSYSREGSCQRTPARFLVRQAAPPPLHPSALLVGALARGHP